MSYVLLKSLVPREFVVSNEAFPLIFDIKKLEKYSKRDKHDVVLKYKRNYYYIKLNDLNKICRIDTVVEFLKTVFKYSQYTIATDFYTLVLNNNTQKSTHYTVLDQLALHRFTAKYVVISNTYTYEKDDAVVVLDDESAYEFVVIDNEHEKAIFFTKQGVRVEVPTNDINVIISLLDESLDDLITIAQMM